VLCVLLCSACNSPDACERVAVRVLPHPDEESVKRCRTLRRMDPEYARVVDCVLAIKGEVMQREFDACHGDKLLFFQF